ncbi:MAG: TolB family protein [Bryobacteraceae bacterium]
MKRFGSIWQVAAEGGTAEQITSSGGYHAHAAWSPKGDRIAFVNGAAPRGRLPNITGALEVVELAGGGVRRIATPPENRRGSNRLDAAWRPRGREIFFVSSRGGEPQVWSFRKARAYYEDQLGKAPL